MPRLTVLTAPVGLFSTLECVHDASWNMALECHECTEGTRSEILYNLSSWLDDISQPQIFWIDGMAGTGKTALAKSVARIASDRKVLGGSFFCSKRSADRRDVRRIIPSIAFHLAAVNEEYCRQVLKGHTEVEAGVCQNASIGAMGEADRRAVTGFGQYGIVVASPNHRGWAGRMRQSGQGSLGSSLESNSEILIRFAPGEGPRHFAA